VFDLDSLVGFHQQCSMKNFYLSTSLRVEKNPCGFSLFLPFVYGSVLELSLVMLVLHLNILRVISYHK